MGWVDGDKCLCLPYSEFVEAAIRDMKNCAALDYEIYGASKTDVTIDGIISGIYDTYSYGDIGTPSNSITKVWDSDLPKETKEKLVAFLVQEVNNRIDFAKTHRLHDIEDEELVGIVKDINKGEFPCFFQYLIEKKAKTADKCKTIAEPRNTMERVVVAVEKFQKGLNYSGHYYGDEKFDYTMLSKAGCSYINQDVIDRFSEMIKTNRGGYDLAKVDIHDITKPQKVWDTKREALDDYRKELMLLEPDMGILTTSLVYHVFNGNRTSHDINVGSMSMLFILFGEEIYNNLCENVDIVNAKKAEEEAKRIAKEEKRIAKEKKKEAGDGRKTSIVDSYGVVHESLKEAADMYSVKVEKIRNNLRGKTKSVKLPSGEKIIFEKI